MSKHVPSGIRTSRVTKILGTSTILAALCLLSACGTNGAYTTEGKNAAKEKMAQLKSATEWQMAQQAFLAGDLPKALKHVSVSIELNDKVVKSYVLRGRVLMEMGNLDGATASFAQAEKTDPADVDTWYYQGILAERIDRKEEALRRYEGANERDPSNPQYAIAAAEMLMAMDRLDEAEKFLEDRKAKFDHSPGVKQTLGHIAMLRGKPADAIPMFNEARLLAPDDQAILEDLIRAQIATGEFGQAEVHLGRLLTNKDNADRRDLLHARAKCLLQLDRPVDARDLLIKITSDPNGTTDADAWVELGQVCYQLRDQARLRTASGRAIALAPTKPDGYVLRALYLRQTGDMTGAEENLRRALDIKQSADSYIMLGVVQRDMKRLSEARANFAMALKVDPTNTVAPKLLAAVAE
ncbi:MAG: tetratricopeptide repeat protein [Phycisphaerales bacterium]|jgi:tetratricopeptide (TPR) repeat protein